MYDMMYEMTVKMTVTILLLTNSAPAASLTMKLWWFATYTAGVDAGGRFSRPSICGAAAATGQ
jgi:hypothetical protein